MYCDFGEETEQIHSSIWVPIPVLTDILLCSRDDSDFSISERSSSNDQSVTVDKLIYVFVLCVSQLPSVYTILFLDEANTTEAVGLVKEILCDGRMRGEPLDSESGVKIIAACNPYRRWVFYSKFLKYYWWFFTNTKVLWRLWVQIPLMSTDCWACGPQVATLWAPIFLSLRAETDLGF